MEKTWILVASEKGARVLELNEQTLLGDIILDLKCPQSKPKRIDLLNNGGNLLMSPPKTLHEEDNGLLLNQFINAVIEKLRISALQGAFSKLIVVSDEKVRPLLNENFPASLEKLLVEDSKNECDTEDSDRVQSAGIAA